MTSLQLRLLAQTLPFLLVIPSVALAQAGPPTRAEAEAALNSAGEPASAAYTAQQIDQLVAPIALYPDQLLSQVLMAATYPQQLLSAAQWLQDPNNAALKGGALDTALQPLPWDPSVKALVAFPQIVTMLTQDVDWTQALGVAFATQQPQVMAQIQQLRQLAMRAGEYRHFAHLLFREEAGYVVIEPEAADEVYVPVYNPAVVYGSYWPAPAYPPVYIPPPTGFIGATIAPGLELSVGFGVVAPLWGWSHPDWRHHWIAVNRTDYARITPTAASPGPDGAWRHRGPVTLVAPAEAARFAQAAGAAAAPHGTVAPTRAAAVAALPRRAAAAPDLIRTGPAHPKAAAAPEQRTPGAPPHPGTTQAAIPPAAGHPPALAAPGRAAVAARSGAEHPGAMAHPAEHAAIPHPAAPHPEVHAAIPHPAAPHPEVHAAIRPAPAAPHPAAPHAAAPHPAGRPAAHAAAPPHPAAAPHPEEKKG